MTLTDNYLKDSGNLEISIAGNYIHNALATSYQRNTNLNYHNNLNNESVSLTLDPANIFVNGASTATITVSLAESAYPGTRTFQLVLVLKGLLILHPRCVSPLTHLVKLILVT